VTGSHAPETPAVRARHALALLPQFVPPTSVATLALEHDGPKLIQLDANESPHGPFPAAQAALVAHAAALHRYPRREGELIERLAERHGLEPERIALGNGADALIGYVSSAYLEPGDEALTAWPSFPTYVLDARKAGATVVLAPLREGAVDLDALAERITPRTRVVWVCTPNNPTGGVVGRASLARFLDSVPERVLVVIDEAYFEYAAGPAHVDSVREHVTRRANVGVLRTFSKIYGLAALRVGWFAGPPEVSAALGKVRHYYDVSEPANVAALASLGEESELERRRADNRRERARLAGGLRELGLEPLPSEANFLAVDVGDAAALADRLLRRGVLVRALDGVGAPNLLRLTVGTPSEVEALLAALADARQRC
jgi:histidinol-phosphate aminotransferase